MGTWNSAIFGDDTACDVRDQFTELLSTGVSAAEATKALLASWAAALQDADDGPIFWLALAATQWKYGCLLPDVQAEAIQIIDSNAGLSRWEGRAAGTRRRALATLRARLLSPQPSARRLRPRKTVIVPTTKVPSPDGRAFATAHEIARPPQPRMQVCVEIESSGGRGGGGVFVADCAFDVISLDWKDPGTLQITYPATARTFERKESMFFCGRTVRVVYRLKDESTSGGTRRE
jgi:hypothetical protein